LELVWQDGDGGRVVLSVMNTLEGRGGGVKVTGIGIEKKGGPEAALWFLEN
jgi:hypothetical protein